VLCLIAECVVCGCCCMFTVCGYDECVCVSLRVCVCLVCGVCVCVGGGACLCVVVCVFLRCVYFVYVWSRC